MKSLPKFLCGGIGAGDWPQMDAKKFAKVLFESRCNNCVLEVVAPAYAKTESGYNDKTLAQMYGELKNFIKPILALDDLWVTLHLTNGNDGMISRYGAENICREIVDKLISDFNGKNIIICPVAETDHESNEQYLVNYCINEWGGRGNNLIFNGGGRPNAIVAGYSLLDYHTQSGNDVGPSVGVTTLVDSDNGPIINWLKAGAPAGKYWNQDRVFDFGMRCKSKGNSLNLYGYQTTSMEKDALNVLGKLYAVRKKPSFFDNLIATIKLLFI